MAMLKDLVFWDLLANPVAFEVWAVLAGLVVVATMVAVYASRRVKAFGLALLLTLPASAEWDTTTDRQILQEIEEYARDSALSLDSVTASQWAILSELGFTKFEVQQGNAILDDILAELQNQGGGTDMTQVEDLLGDIAQAIGADYRLGWGDILARVLSIGSSVASLGTIVNNNIAQKLDQLVARADTANTTLDLMYGELAYIGDQAVQLDNVDTPISDLLAELTAVRYALEEGDSSGDPAGAVPAFDQPALSAVPDAPELADVGPPDDRYFSGDRDDIAPITWEEGGTGQRPSLDASIPLGGVATALGLQGFAGQTIELQTNFTFFEDHIRTPLRFGVWAMASWAMAYLVFEEFRRTA
jgi:hypothetical protein